MPDPMQSFTQFLACYFGGLACIFILIRTGAFMVALVTQ
jgi:hypothetical protein